MTQTTARRWAGSAILVALLLAVLAALVAATPAQARIVTIELTFDQLMPGEERSDVATVTLPREARLTDVVVGEEGSDPGAFDWQVELCPPSGACVPVVAESEGARVPRGEHALEVTVTLDEDAPALATSTISGRLVFTELDGEDGLPPTGATPALLVAAVTLLLAGVGLVRLAGRRPTEVRGG